MSMLIYLLLLTKLFTTDANAISPDASIWDNSIFATKSKRFLTLQEFVANLNPGELIYIGETHDSQWQHSRQVALLEAVTQAKSAVKISVGMEFFEYTKQNIVNSFLNKELSETEFLKQVGWGKNDFSQYREQVLLPASTKGKCFAINLPRRIANKIAFNGLASLSEDERAALPKDFTQGRDSYRQRFYQYIQEQHGEMDSTELENFFAAQSAWDDTMAWQIQNALAEDLQQILFVIVGNFHVEYGGGLADRSQARGISKQSVLIQEDVSSLTETELQKYLENDPQYGPRADYIWIKGEPLKNAQN